MRSHSLTEILSRRLQIFKPMSPTFIPDQNPLKSHFELNDDQKAAFKFAVRAEELLECVFSAEYHLEKGDLERGLKEVKYATDDDFESRMDARAEDRLSWLKEPHAGDCTCFPCSCIRCHAEGILGLDSTPGLDKYMGHEIFRAFQKYESINEVLTFLEKLHEGTHEHVDRWNATRQRTLEWLKEYKNKYFPG